MLPDKVFLASKSPRRLELLGFAFNNVQQIQSPLDEPKWDLKQSVKAYLDLCIGVKGAGAQMGYAVLPKKPKWALLVAADTIVTRGRRVYGKPDGPEGALAMLKELMGREHSVVTAYYLGLFSHDRLKAQHTASIRTRVRFRPSTQRQLRDYVATGEPLDKSGSYGVQGPALQFVESVDGSYASVMGLPIYEIHSKVNQWRQRFAGGA